MLSPACSRAINACTSAALFAATVSRTPFAYRSRASSPKFQVFDVALQSSQSEDAMVQSGPTATMDHPETLGRLVESAVGAHLLNTASRSLRVSYSREGNKEVNLVLSSRDRLLAFQRHFPSAQALVVVAGGLPHQEFLGRSAADWFHDFTQPRGHA